MESLALNNSIIIFPLSISRLQNSQSPDACISYIETIDSHVDVPNNDVVFIYTDGLYQNSEEVSYKLRKKIVSEISSHHVRLTKLLKKVCSKNDYIPASFNYISYNQLLLNKHFPRVYNYYLRAFGVDSVFRDAVESDLKSREFSEANIHFLIEELTVSTLLRSHKTPLPQFLSEDSFRLIVYPGLPQKTDRYIPTAIEELRFTHSNDQAYHTFDPVENKSYSICG